MINVFSFVSNVCVGFDLLQNVCVCGCENILTCRCIIAIKAAGAQEKKTQVSLFSFFKQKYISDNMICHLISCVFSLL